MFEGKTALVVDDVEINLEIIAAVLENTAMQFVFASNGREAVETFASDPKKFDVVLMDINMPEMDGIEATRQIRLTGPEGAKVPIIAVTANIHPAEVKNCLDAGMTDHIGKPIEFDEVLKKIESYIS